MTGALRRQTEGGGDDGAGPDQTDRPLADLLHPFTLLVDRPSGFPGASPHMGVQQLAMGDEVDNRDHC